MEMTKNLLRPFALHRTSALQLERCQTVSGHQPSSTSIIIHYLWVNGIIFTHVGSIQKMGDLIFLWK
jgi:hypothetical protein